MKKAFILPVVAFLCVIPAAFGQEFDFKTLDKIGANASSSTNVSLNSTLLRLGAAVLGHDGDTDVAAIKSLISNLKGIYVRAWEFDHAGQYSESDLAPLRAFLKQPAWENIVDVRDHKESTQIFMSPAPNNKLGGVVIVSTEPTQVTVVYINGIMEMSDIAKLSGTFGVPDVKDLIRERPRTRKDK